jgi:type IV secretion system protein VirB9
MRCWYLLLVVGLLGGCPSPEPPPPPVPPPAEDLSTWTVPVLVQPERSVPRPQAVRPATLPVGAAEKVLAYKPGVVVEVSVAPGAPLDIVFEEGEQVRQIVDGDRAPAAEGQHRRWEVKEGADGAGPTLRPHVFVTTTEPGLVNGLTITTTRRTYLVTCKSVAHTPVRVLRWLYAPDSRPPTPEAPTDAPGLLPHPEQPMRYHIGYRLEAQGRMPDWTPRGLFDDGKKMYIVYPEVTLFGTVPLVRKVGPNGPQLINARQYLSVVILDELAGRLELRVGLGETAEVVTISRGNLRTIDCPSHPECPQWPAAAAVLAGGTP